MAMYIATGVFICAVLILGILKGLICLVFPVFKYVFWALIVAGWIVLVYVVMSTGFNDPYMYWEPGPETWIRNIGFFLVPTILYWAIVIAAKLILYPVKLIFGVLDVARSTSK